LPHPVQHTLAETEEKMNEETKIGNVNIAVINIKKGVEPKTN
jgi:hypothetical protein